MFMKRVLFLFLENGQPAINALEEIRSEGYNGTLVGGASLRHAFEDMLPEERHFFSLANWEADNNKESTLSLFIVDEKDVDVLKDAIRKCTDDFKTVKGAFFSLPLDDYEGSF